jgi:hypothetical protein
VIDLCALLLFLAHSLMFRLAFDVLGENELERELALLDQAREKLETNVMLIQNNLPAIRQVLSAPAAPHAIKAYLFDIVSVAEQAQEWATTLEGNLLSALSVDDVTPAVAAIVIANNAPPPELPAPIEPTVINAAAQQEDAFPQESLEALRLTAEQLAVDVLNIASGPDPDFGAALASKKTLIATVLKRRERLIAEGATESAAQCTAIVEFLEKNVVAVKSIADALKALGETIYRK